MGQKHSNTNDLLSSFDKDIAKCLAQAGKDRVNLGKEGTDDELESCLKTAMDNRPSATSPTTSPATITVNTQKKLPGARRVVLGHH